MLQAAVNAAHAALAEAKRESLSAKAKVQQATNELHSLQRSSGPHQEAMAFDDQAGLLLDEIHKNRQLFSKPVLGPVGACISLERSANRYACFKAPYLNACYCCVSSTRYRVHMCFSPPHQLVDILRWYK